MKKDNSRLYTYITTIAAFLQLSLPQWNLSDVYTQALTAALLAIVSVFTILKQRVSVEVDSKAVMYTWVLVGAAALGGINELVGIIHINANLQAILRTSIATLIGLLNLMSKTFFPTEAGKALQGTKDAIKSGTATTISSIN